MAMFRGAYGGGPPRAIAALCSAVMVVHQPAHFEPQA